MDILGIDIGGSGIKGAIVDVSSGEIKTERYRLPTPEGAFPEDVAETIAQVVKNFSYQGPVGMGFPAVIIHGVCLSAANIDPSWIETNVNGLIGNKIGMPAYTVNDADAAGVAEMRFGAGRGFDRGVVIMLTLGTGIGSAVFTNGILVPNTELGHIEIRGKDAERRASDAARKRKNLSWEEWAERFQEYLEYIEKLFSPDMIILGGGASKESERFLNHLDTRAKLIPAQLLNQAGIIGAAIYASEQN
ncbi:transcriptional regulator/sugar kinase [Longilinea arvoryzae]|uniref:Transcriptional regulator/sugar kinase n=1 Tax=Longilinea arvoryzae TaxID=360412 RepID=A0A0S7BMH8_9CHLR|nr:ROK family protein [Longilinea arvoryzae]GAP15013.1 transcriptional regulator/sugar kinase [Longilinea arvoryzae]